MFGASSKALFRREVKVAKMCMEKFTLVAFLFVMVEGQRH